MTARKALVVASLFTILLMLACVQVCFSQQADAAASQPTAVSVASEIWQFVPADSQFIVAYDGRPENPTNQVAMKFTDKEQLQRQQVAFRKAVESFATLFGVSIDFAAEIDPWLGDQMAFAWIPGQDASDEMGHPVFIITSRDEAAADRMLDELLAPWQRVGEVKTAAIEGGASVKSFTMKKHGVQVYAAARGPVAAISTTAKGIQSALTTTGFAEGSVGERTFKALAGSNFYIYADPLLLKTFARKQMEIPLQSVGLGTSAVETGSRVRIVSFPSEALLPLLTQVLPASKTGIAEANPGIPGNSLAVTTLPDLSGIISVVSVFGGGNPQFDLLGALTGTRISVGLTAVLPKPVCVISVATESEAAAKEKADKIAALLQEVNLPAVEAPQIPGLQVNAVQISKNMTLLWTQVGQYLLAGSDALSLQQAAASAAGQTESIIQVEKYNETISALQGSNLETLYVNLAPIQGLGYLAEGLGISHISPVHAALVSSIQNLQSLGAGVGFDGQMLNATLFLKAKPGAHPTIGPAVTLGTAVAAAVALPMLAKSREAARLAECQSNLKQLATAAIMYADDHKGYLPSRLTWQKDLSPYLRAPISELTCPVDSGKKTIYAFNKNLGGLNINNIQNPAEVVMFFEADASLPGATGSRANAVLAHKGRGNFAYVEGNVATLDTVPSQNHWVPKYSYPKPAGRKK